MNGYPEKITRVIYAYGNLTIKLHVKILDDKNEPLHTEYEYGKKKYLKLDNFVYLTLDITESGQWDQSKSIMITQYNMHVISSAINKVIKDIYNGSMYAMKKNGELIIYKDKVVECTQQVNIVSPPAALLIEPTIVYDDNEIGYEGVNLFINKRENVIQIPIHYLEALKYTLDKIDLFHYSQLLLNYFVSYYGGSNERVFERKHNVNRYKQNISFDNPNVETTSANFRRPSDDSDIFGFDRNKIG